MPSPDISALVSPCCQAPVNQSGGFLWCSKCGQRIVFMPPRASMPTPIGSSRTCENRLGRESRSEPFCRSVWLDAIPGRHFSVTVTQRGSQSHYGPYSFGPYWSSLVKSGKVWVWLLQPLSAAPSAAKGNHSLSSGRITGMLTERQVPVGRVCKQREMQRLPPSLMRRGKSGNDASVSTHASTVRLNTEQGEQERAIERVSVRVTTRPVRTPSKSATGDGLVSMFNKHSRMVYDDLGVARSAR